MDVSTKNWHFLRTIEQVISACINLNSRVLVFTSKITNKVSALEFKYLKSATKIIFPLDSYIQKVWSKVEFKFDLARIIEELLNVFESTLLVLKIYRFATRCSNQISH